MKITKKIDPSSLSKSPVMSVFAKPDLDSRPMARMWFPDAGAGQDDHDCIKEQFVSMAAGGIGGVEVALLGDDAGNTDGQNFGWGSPNWVKVMKKVMKAASEIDGGFKVDFTITAHWPPVVNTIDPNDPGASSNMTFAWKKLEKSDFAAKKVVLPLPETGLYDSGRNPFIFTDTLAGAVIAKMTGDLPPKPEMPHMGNFDQSGLHHFGPERIVFEGKITEAPAVPPAGEDGEAPMMMPPGMSMEPKVPFVLKLDSLTDVTGKASVMPELARGAGVPDEKALKEYYGGKEALEKVIDVFGPPADEKAPLPDGKRDKNLNRKRMADTQNTWTLDVSQMDEAMFDGSHVVVACYYRGTGQIFSGGFKSRLMKNMTYAANYFTVAGTRAITDYWDTYMLSDKDLLAMMKRSGETVGGAIFEDSIELMSNGSHWGADFMSQIEKYAGYSVAKYLPVYAGLYFDDALAAARLDEDYKYALGQMYQNNHIEYLNKWTAGFNYKYRAQAGMMGINIGGANAVTGITEGDNGTFKDANRRLSAGRNMMGQVYHSFESNTFTGFPFPWKLLIQECNYDSSNGTNRPIFHGTAYPKNVNGCYDWWPGWNWGGGGSHGHDFMAWDRRICWWDDANVITGYLCRQDGILQKGQMKVDLAVYPSDSQSIMHGGSHYQKLTDKGYSYHIVDDGILALPNAVASNGLLCEKGCGYKSIILSGMTVVPFEVAKKLLSYAKAGLPVIFEGGLPERVRGVEQEGRSDADLRAVMAELLEIKNVYRVKNEDELLLTLKALGLNPAASYDQSMLETSKYVDDFGAYYTFYNDTEEAVSTKVTLTGDGVPALMELWSGQLIPVAEFQQIGGAVSFDLALAQQEMKVYSLGKLAAEKPIELTPMSPVKVESWNVNITSYGPPEIGDTEYDPECPINCHRTDVSFAVPAGIGWESFPADDALLKKLRVSAMADVSGEAVYETEITLPDDAKAIRLDFTHGDRDMLVGGSINGIKLPEFNCMEDTLLVADGVKGGVNKLVIKLAGNLNNRLCFETPRLMEGRDLSGLSFGGGKRDYSIRHSTGIFEMTATPFK